MSDIYKAKDRYSGAWIEGYLRESPRDNWASISVENGGSWIEFEETIVDPKTICQATKLKDKNNKTIFDKDRLRVHVFYEGLGENLGVVEKELEFECVISMEEMGLWLHCDTEEMSGYILHFNYQFHEESFEVIDNIHD